MATLATTIGRGTLAARPATMPEGSLYFVTDTSTLYRSDGATWEAIEADITSIAYTAENARDDIGAALVAGTGIDITLSDGSDTITIAAEAGAIVPGAHTHPSTDVTDFAEAVDDRVGALLVEGTGIDLTYDDGGGTLTIAATAPTGAVPAPIPGLMTGRWYGVLEAGSWNTAGASGMLANRLYLMPLALPKACTADRIGISVTTLAATTTIRLGIYALAADGTPGALILDAGTVSATTTGLKEITISQALAAGWYWLAAIANGAPSVNSLASWLGPDLNGQSTAGAVGRSCGWAVTNAAYHAALPSPPTGMADGSAGPIVSVRIA